MTNLTAKFKVGQELVVVASGWGLGPHMIGHVCTVSKVMPSSDCVRYQVKGLPDLGESQVSDDVWEQSFQVVEKTETKGEKAQKLFDRLAEIKQAMAELEAESAELMTQLVQLAD